ncbi:hypothetical protein [uncultured Roseobacter sp.]|uniref:hypothetical protein n=1 Tax=uncultured Roseobacter sp. TaxID=114847 RepID=UPI00262CACD8|nr:hypothetical protein [uncultured Roseobacter sp.]
MRLPFQAPPTVLMILVVIAALASAKLAEAGTAPPAPDGTPAQIDLIRSPHAAATEPPPR